MTSHIKLYGDKGERFEEIKADMTDELGYEPSNPEVIGLLMAQYSANSGPSTRAETTVRRATENSPADRT